MPTYFQRPENALKRANEFIDVGKKQRALDALYDVIKSKRHRTWQKIHEPIMEKYLHLCVDLKKSHIAKEGLYQYKNICQQVNTKSLEDVVKKYLALAEEKTEFARQESQQTADDVDDLDVLQTPESLLMSAVSGEDMQDRTDRTILTPWLKFLWESYRQCLDLLRNNVSIEKLYHEVSQNAFKFCLKYNRKTEFRKLCEILRTHLSHICKHQNQQRTININNPETQNMHLETRIVQLDIAIQMELWQEAFKAVEDIHLLITLAKKSPKPALMANYLTKFGLVLYKSDNFMFHACAWHRLYHLYREQRKTLSEHELQKLASRVLCATLAIPLSGSRSDQLLDFEDNSVEKQKRLMNLLSLPCLPTRQSLVKDLVKYNIVQCVYPELQNLYQWIEVEFNPLKLASRVQCSLDFISKKDELVQYTSALQDVTVMRVVKQVSEIYQTIEFAHLSKLAPFADNFRLEKIIVNAAKSMDLQVRIDHRTGSLTFGSRMGMSQDAGNDGPSIQSMPSEQMRHQLINMANAVDKAMSIISPKEMKAAREELRLRIMQSYRQTAKKEHQSLLRRRQIIEDRKEELENINTQREMKELELQEEQRRRQIEEQTSRLEREAEERERQRRKEEYKGIQRKVVQERIDQLKKTPLGDRALAQYTEEQLAEMEPDDILAKQIEQLEKEKRELQDKLKLQEKKVDYFERAKHLKEKDLLADYIEKERAEMKQFWEQQELERIELAKKERLLALELRDRLERIRPDHDMFMEKLKSERAAVYKEKLVEFDRRLAEERVKRLDDRRRQRREDRRKRWLLAKEEEEQRKKDEELKRQREEEERIAREKRERDEAEYKAKAAKLQEIEDKKRQRELEIEDKLRRKTDTIREKKDDERTIERDEERVGGWRALPKEGGWRSREKAKEESWRSGPRNDDDPKQTRPDDERADPEEPQWRDADRGPKDDRDKYRDDRDRLPEDRDRPRDDRERDRGFKDDRDRFRDERDRDRLRDDRDRPVDDRERDRDRRRDGSPPSKDGRDWRRTGPSDERDSWRRGPPGRDDRPQASGGGWRDRERQTGDRPRYQDDWRKDDRPRIESDRHTQSKDFDRRDRDGDRLRDRDRDGDRQRDRDDDRHRDRDFDRKDRDFDRRDRDREMDRSKDVRDRGGPRDRDLGPRDRPGPRDSYDKPREFDRSRDSYDRRDDRDRDNRNQPSRDWRSDDRAPPRDDWRNKAESRGGRQGGPEDDRDRGRSSHDAPEDNDGWSVVRH